MRNNLLCIIGEGGEFKIGGRFGAGFLIERRRDAHLAGDLFDCLQEELVGIGAGKAFLGADEAGQARCGEGDDAQEAEGVGKGLDAAAPLDDAANADTQHGDLFLEAGEAGGFEVGLLGLAEAAGVEAVFEGVGIAEGRAGTA